MRLPPLAVLLSVAASPAFAGCPTVVSSDVATEINGRTDAMLCEQGSLAESTALRFRLLQLEAELKAQQALLEQQMILQQQQLAALAAPVTP